MASAHQRPRTVIGPLTSTFTPPASCTNAIAQCATSCSTGFLGQTCATGSYATSNPSAGHADATSCWPPAAPSAPTPTPPFGGWGFYSPGLICPMGYSSACSATASGSTAGGHGVEFSMLPGETAVGCCPTGFTCSVNSLAQQTCQSGAGYFATFPVVTCSAGASDGLTDMAIPTTITASQSTYAITTYEIYAPMVEIRWQSSDLPANSTSATTAPTSSSTASPGLSTGAIAAIAVIIPVIVLLIAALLGFFCWRRRKSRTMQATQTNVPRESHAPSYYTAAPPYDYRELDRPISELRSNPLHEMEEQHRRYEMESPKVTPSELAGSEYFVAGKR